jgi:hypothetical protein
MTMGDRSAYRKPRADKRAGKEIFEVLPVILGGSPIDPQNKALLSRQQHVEAVRYWNRVIRDQKRPRT